MTAKKKGRPPLPKGEARTATLTVQLRPGELKELRQMANLFKSSVSDYVRRRLLGTSA